MTIEQVIEKQMQAFDNRDIESMMTVFNNDIKIINFSDNKILIDGFEECREMYSVLFKNSPKLYAEIINTIIFENKVIVHEFIFGRNGSDKKMEQVIIFEVENEKISKISIIR
ncbi:nuclear transport factor 2 family protein [Mucilaginibacter sp. X5P1]|uniref:nuclear transport factor 2 family protein n=1 Tax=Mucilaginibacter sp. X5P1 TaxID=2723088 RepID=UPI00161B16D6|nr:nuclear transport factor 2 family protein [Mucilaginibacter sp. X5P1]MBB6138712.1 hypothetical protein [Mucilaginibacter sp. X5P1]